MLVKGINMKERIRTFIIDEVGPYYTNKNLDDVVDVFLDILEYEVNNSSLKGVGKRIENALDLLVSEKQDRQSLSILLPTICKVEPFTRKVYFMINESAYIGLCNRKENNGFAAVLAELGVERKDKAMKSVYELRNLEAHSCKDWTTRQYYDKITDSLIAYLIVTNSKYTQLKKKLKENTDEFSEKIDFTEYAKGIVNNFQQKVKKTIQLNSEENVNLSEMYVEEQTKCTKGRSGTLRHLMDTIEEKRIILWGDAGAGKTTTLEHLVYQDAKSILNGQGKIPVLIYLGAATNEHYTLEDYIQQKLNIEPFALKQLLSEGRINLYFDGFNEIPMTEMNMLKTKRRRELAEIMATYDKTFIVLTNRPQDGKEFSNIPVFNLLRMNDGQIKEFLNCNVDSPDVMKLVNDAIEEDINLKNMVKIPLILKSLIFIAKTTGEIPKREGVIIGKFLKALFAREKQEKYDEYLDEKKITLLLRKLGYESLENNRTNAGMSEEYVLDIMSKCQSEYKFTYDNLYALQLAIHLGILEKKEGLYVFAHQSYQDYYHSQELVAILEM